MNIEGYLAPAAEYSIAITLHYRYISQSRRITLMSDSKRKQPRGLTAINAELCKGCGFCIAFCPAKVLEFSEEFNSKGYHPPYAIRPEDCSGCGLCGIYCPDFAIFGVVIKEVA
jgi:2-oxoglutarate ferredoxin oxidoreductase subunit delta